MESFGKRLDFMLRETGIEKTHLASALGVHRSTVHWWINDMNVPRSIHLDRIKEIFSDFDSNWIQYGKGEMYKEGSGINKKIEELEKSLKDKDLIIKLLQEKLESLTK